MNRAANLSFARCAGVAAVAALAHGCATQPQVAEPQPELRQSVDTAPADLQLACAAEAARV